MERADRLAAVIVPLSPAGDLGMGKSMGHASRTAYLAALLADRVGLRPADRADALYTALLRGVGCVGDAHDMALEYVTDDLIMKREFATAGYGRPPELVRAMFRTIGSQAPLAARPVAILRGMRLGPARANEYLRAHCEVGSIVVQRLGLGEGVARPLRAIFERWDGRGSPDHLRREAIPLVARLVHAAAFLDTFGSAVGRGRATRLLGEQAGRALDPILARELRAMAGDDTVWSVLDDAAFTERLLELEPAPARMLVAEAIDDALLAFADFADLKSPYTIGHSRGVARLAEAAARSLRLPSTAVIEIRRAALVHDLGRVAISNSILDKPHRLSDVEWERMRLHPYHAERVLARSLPLAPLAALASAHHEHLDGSGYYRGSRGAQLPLGARVLAAADALHAMTEERPHRPGLPAPLAIADLRVQVTSGRLDTDAAEAVVAAARGRRPSRDPPATLTARELEVLRLVARGRGNKEVARDLAISGKTVGHHLERVYEKLGVSTRSGAVMRALERGWLAVGSDA